MVDDDRDGAPVRVNRKAQWGWLIGLLVAVAVVFGVLAIALKESILNPPKVGHEHTHDQSQGGGPGGPGAPPGAPSGGPDAPVGRPDPHAGHDHGPAGGGAPSTTAPPAHPEAPAGSQQHDVH